MGDKKEWVDPGSKSVLASTPQTKSVPSTHCLLHLRQLGSDDMHGIVVGVYSDCSSVSLAVCSCSIEVDEHSDSEVVGVATIAGSAAVATLVGSDPLVGSAEVLTWVVAEEACCLGFCCLSTPSPCGQ